MSEVYQKKVCTSCGVEKLLMDFEKRRNGYHTQCKTCLTEKRKTREQKDSPEVLATRRQKRNDKKTEKRRAAGMKERRIGPMPEPVLKEAQKGYSQKWRGKNPDKVRKINANNVEKRRLWIKKWRSEHPNEVAALNAQRYEYTHIEYVDLEFVTKRDNYTCHICQQAIMPGQEINFDHVVPLCRGGSHTTDNVKITHGLCNRRKADKLMSELTPYDRSGI